MHGTEKGRRRIPDRNKGSIYLERKEREDEGILGVIWKEKQDNKRMKICNMIKENHILLVPSICTFKKLCG